MDCYGPLAEWYDDLTRDVPYGEFADFYERLFREDGGGFSLLLDLCCGTGTLTAEMTRRGYEMIAADASEDMLLVAREASSGLEPSPLFLCQEASELDLYGTVDACFSSLDSINYIPPEELGAVFSRLRLFVRPGGLFIFDVRSPEWLRSMDGKTYVDETDDVLCLWRADFSEEDGAVTYGMDIFSRRGRLWERESEFHVEYAYETEALASLLEGNGFGEVRVITDGPQGGEGRVFIVCRRREA